MPLSVIYSCESTLQCSVFSFGDEACSLAKGVGWCSDLNVHGLHLFSFYASALGTLNFVRHHIRKPHVLCLYQKTIILDRLMAKKQGSIFLELLWNRQTVNQINQNIYNKVFVLAFCPWHWEAMEAPFCLTWFPRHQIHWVCLRIFQGWKLLQVLAQVELRLTFQVYLLFSAVPAAITLWKKKSSIFIVIN